MSLLNEMLNDLNNRAPHRPDVVLIPRVKRHWTKLAVPIILGLAFVATLGITVVLLRPLLHHDAPMVSSLVPVASVPLVSLQEEAPVEHDLLESHILPLVLEDTNTSSASSMNEAMVKQNLSLDNKHEEQLNDALDAIEDGNDPRAVDVLTQLLRDFPDSVDGRENLAGLYLEHGKIREANAVLDEGLARDSHNLRLVIVKSHVLVEQAHHREALKLLEPFNPDMTKHPDYYAVLAAIFNALGRTNEAGSLYQALLRMDPSNGQYYLGLGIALEQKHSIQQAIEAYKQASQSDGIQPAVRMYAENRLNVLQG